MKLLTIIETYAWPFWLMWKQSKAKSDRSYEAFSVENYMKKDNIKLYRMTKTCYETLITLIPVVKG